MSKTRLLIMNPFAVDPLKYIPIKKYFSTKKPALRLRYLRERNSIQNQLRFESALECSLIRFSYRGPPRGPRNPAFTQIFCTNHA